MNFTLTKPGLLSLGRRLLLWVCGLALSGGLQSLHAQCTYPNPTVSGTTSIGCGLPTTLTASGNGPDFWWFEQASGGNPVATGAIFTTPALGQSKTYYVENVTGNLNNSQTFSYTGAQQSFVVPAGVTSIEVDIQGAQGGSTSFAGGFGGRVQSRLTVTPGQTIYIFVGNQGSSSGNAFNGGGAPANTNSRGGGGASDIRIGGTALTDRVIVAGGGGGAGYYGNWQNAFGGAGGGLTGGTAYSSNGSANGQDPCVCGTGGTQSAGGTNTCSPGLGSLGQGGNGTSSGGGGGGGYYGGGGGYNTVGGGGGSSYTNPLFNSNVIHTQSYRASTGVVVLRWNETSCKSARVAVPVTVTSIATPTVSGTTVTCGQQATLTASGSTGTYSWYNQPVGGTELSNNASFTTGNIVTSQVYYVEALSSTTPTIITYSYTGSQQSFVVPAGVTSILVDAKGAQGGNNVGGALGGRGGRIQTSIPVTPGETIYLYVGEQPSSTNGGWNGGGNGFNSSYGRGGGGASDIRRGGTSLGDRVIVAGGGGGTGWNCGAQQERGGNGGGSGTAEDGYYCNSSNTTYSGKGASQTAGGSGGTYTQYLGFGTFGVGGNAFGSNYGGGGGGGWYGGGGGAFYGGGGGGSSYAYILASNTIHTQGFQTGNGEIIISYAAPTCKSSRVAVQVSPTALQVPSVTVPTLTCGGTGVATVSGSSNQYNWYTQPSGGTAFSHASNLDLTGISINTTYYLEAVSDTNPVDSAIFNYTGTPVSWTVPAGVTSIIVDMSGAQGGAYNVNNNGGRGGRVQSTLAVTPGQVLNIYVGNQPNTVTGGFNGGGNGFNLTNGRGGGGASDIRIGGNALTDRVLVAGGGGGSGGQNCNSEHGGHGGGPGNAQNGFSCNNYDSYYAGAGGSQSAGGNNAGYYGGSATLGQGSNAYQSGCGNQTSGGGGGGYYGGGGGSCYGGGGGGSSYHNPSLNSNVTHTQGYRSGNGRVAIYYPGAYCASTRIPVQIVVNPLASPVAADDTVNCGSPATLTVSGSSGNYKWFTQPAGGTELAQGSTFALAPVYTPTTYYVEAYALSVSPAFTQTFTYTGTSVNWTVPADVTSINFDMTAAQGGNNSNGALGGLGGRVQGTLSVTPGEVLQFNVGGQPSNNSAGWNGGGIGYNSQGTGGGGASDIRKGGTALSNRVAVAGGGGGTGWNCGAQQERGGNGGGLTAAENGFYCNSYNSSYAGGGANQSAGGSGSTYWSASATMGTLGQGGPAYSGGSHAGGGGGGYYGGGGGSYYGGGGGGSSYTNPLVISNPVHTQGFKTGNGEIFISYNKISTCTSNRIPVNIVIDSLPAPSVTGNASFCTQGSTSFTASGGTGTYTWYDAPGGNVLATGPNYTTPTETDTTEYYVQYANAGCVSGYGIGTLTVTPIPNPSILTAGPLCSSDSPFNLVAASSVGTWTGPGVTNPSTGAFDPQQANIGNNQLIFTVGQGLCTDADTVTILINQGPNGAIINPGALCSDGSPIVISAQTPGGTWTGTGITNPATGDFDPQQANIGNNPVVYTITAMGCTAIDTLQLLVNATPDATITNPGAICSNSSLLNLTAQSGGGTWTGTGIINPATGNFDPQQANIGNNQVVYSVTQNNCTSTDTIQVMVTQAPNATINNPGILCNNAGVIGLTAQTNGGTWNGTGIVNPAFGTFNTANAILGTNIITYQVTQNNCYDADTIQIIVNQAPDATITSNPGAICSNAQPFNLASLFPGGTWTGNAISNGSAGTFDPSLAVIGNNTITYSITQNNCTDNDIIQVPVLQAPNGTIVSNPGQVCTNDAPFNLFALSSGGFWTGTGITNAGNGTFTPSLANPGVNTIYYNVTLNNCSDADTIQITVNANPTATITPNNMQSGCEGTGISFTGSGGTSYQWYEGGNLIGGATSPTYNTSIPGSYSVLVGNPQGCFTQSLSVPVNIYPKPVIYGITANGACEGTPMNFSQQSNVPNTYGSVISSFQWSFGDANTGSGMQVSHQYANAGSYNAQLIITTNHGCTDTLIQTVYVNPLPVINAMNVADVCYPNAAQFSANTSVANINGAVVNGFQWNFGDNYSSSLPVIGHNYQNPGIYTYSLTATTNHGCAVTSSGQVNVFAQPDAMFLTNNICSGSTATFTDYSNGNGGTITGWAWNFGDGVGVSNQQHPSYNYSSPGTYAVGLTVTTAAGCTDTYMQNVQVAASPDASWSSNYVGGTSVNLIPNNADQNASYSWHFVDDNSYSSQMNVFKSFPQTGSYQVCLTVTKNGCTTTSCGTVYVGSTAIEDVEESMNWSVYPNPFTANYNIDVNLSNTADLGIIIYDMTGRIITKNVYQQVGAGKHTYQYNADELTMRAGAYLVEITVNGKPYTSRIIKTE